MTPIPDALMAEAVEATIIPEPYFTPRPTRYAMIHAALVVLQPAIEREVVERCAEVFGRYLDDIYVRDGFCDWADVANARDMARRALLEDGGADAA